MAKQMNGYMGGFSGKLGPAVGYCWNGKWCMRSRSVVVRNPRTEAQQEHRRAFKEQVQLAAQMRMVVTASLTLPARKLGMTSYNLFVSMNQAAFAGGGVDYSLLSVSTGELAPVAFGVPSIDEDNVLTVTFEPNPLRVRADGYDGVRLYAFCPDQKKGFLSAPVYRRTKRIAVQLPSAFAGHELHLYGFVQAEDGRCSESSYIAWPTEEDGTPQPEGVSQHPIVASESNVEACATTISATSSRQPHSADTALRPPAD